MGWAGLQWVGTGGRGCSGWVQEVGGAAVRATGTCALRLLRLWLYVNITSDACRRAGQVCLLHITSPCNHHVQGLGGPWLPSWCAGQTGVRAGLSSHERRRRTGEQVNVEQVHCFKFLDVLMNDTLTWSDHVNMVCNKVARSLSLLRRLSWFLPQSLLLLYVKSYILPSFDYCDVVWSGCTKAEALRLQTLFNFACRIVLRRRRDYSASAARRQLGLSTLSARRNLHLAQTMFKCLSFQSPPYLSQLFSAPSTHYNTRSSSSSQLNLPTTRTSGRWGFVHITQCWGLVTNGSNHWILRQPDQVSIT